MKPLLYENQSTLSEIKSTAWKIASYNAPFAMADMPPVEEVAP
ncbi:MAG: hypothetical protein CM15mP38_0680 [Synechococcus sp.]|nr:MAG: hypothetical protein CM15mP38_0680 [Synechococcus sp.]